MDPAWGFNDPSNGWYVVFGTFFEVRECLGTVQISFFSATEASKLFHKLREKFGKERKKVVQSMPRSGAGAGVPTYTSPWIFYKELEFLTNHIQAMQYVTMK